MLRLIKFYQIFIKEINSIDKGLHQKEQNIPPDIITKTLIVYLKIFLETQGSIQQKIRHFLMLSIKKKLKRIKKGMDLAQCLMIKTFGNQDFPVEWAFQIWGLSVR